MKNHSLLNFLIFTCFLVIGYSVSTGFYQSDYGILASTMREVTSGSQNSIETMNNGQRSILLISASSISTSNPHLESIWLVTYFSSDTAIQLLPIFPTGKKAISDFEQQLDHSFDLNKKNGNLVLDQDFITVLEKNNYWWSGYFIFDEISLAKLFNPLGDIVLNGKTLSGEQALKEIPEVLENHQEAYSSQIAILQSVCHKYMEIHPDPDISQFISFLPNHILTDLDTNQLQTELETLYSNERHPTCRFPTLEISRIEP
ncbi:MAG: hypothetical protein WAM09_04885 [Anaerolineales bacterium]